MGVNMDCYGKYKANEACMICEYEASCRFYTNSPKLRLLSNDHLSLDTWRGDCQGEEDPYFAEEPEHSISLPKVKQVLRTLLLLDEYTLFILTEIIVNRANLIDIAGKRKISKQCMHKKILRTSRRFPWLVPCFVLLFQRGKKEKYKIKTLK